MFAGGFGVLMFYIALGAAALAVFVVFVLLCYVGQRIVDRYRRWRLEVDGAAVIIPVARARKLRAQRLSLKHLHARALAIRHRPPPAIPLGDVSRGVTSLADRRPGRLRPRGSQLRPRREDPAS